MTANAARAGVKAISGQMVWRKRWAPVGTKSSLVIILMASVIGWISPMIRIPKISARFAPIRSCMRALCLRSTQVMIGMNPMASTAKMKRTIATVPTVI